MHEVTFQTRFNVFHVTTFYGFYESVGQFIWCALCMYGDCCTVLLSRNKWLGLTKEIYRLKIFTKKSETFKILENKILDLKPCCRGKRKKNVT